MLENDFGELDNDFITLWSRFLLSANFEIFKQIEKLAELGQINAVQSYYHKNSRGVNNTIDKIVESYNGTDFNELLAMSNANVRNEYIEKQLFPNSEAELIEEFCVLESINEINDLRKSAIKAVYFWKAIARAEQLFETRFCPLVGERLVEMNNSIKHSDYSTDRKNNNLLHRLKIKKISKNVRKMLMESFKSYNGNIRKFVEEKPQEAFALGKNCELCNGDKALGYELLSTLAKREFSEKFSNYLKNSQTEKTETKIEKKEQISDEEYIVSRFERCGDDLHFLGDDNGQEI